MPHDVTDPVAGQGAHLEVVICTYNRSADLDRCLGALALQGADFALWRVTVIDNNCTDDTPQVVARWAETRLLPGLSRVVETRQGLTPARQRGIGDSRADWVALVDDDCMLAPDWVEEALRFASGNPRAGAFGGRVLPDWGRAPPAHLARNGWLFAEQNLGDEVKEVPSLVGAGVVLNRRALERTGWTAHPILADRTAKGHLSGGDVEISVRLRAAGLKLFYVPTMRIAHRIATERQGLRKSLGLARGLGAGAELVDLMCAPDEARWEQRSRGALRRDIGRHARALGTVLARRWSGWDWLVLAAFLSGRYGQNRKLRRSAGSRLGLAGACVPGLAAKQRFGKGLPDDV